jgi:cell division protein FtsB
MISELRDEEILDFLMTSDFEQEYKPEEFKYLLMKWRFFYRILNGRYELQKTNSDHDLSSLSEEIKRLKTQISELQTSVADKENQIHQLQNRKLTLKERMSGKIIQKDEDK